MDVHLFKTTQLFLELYYGVPPYCMTKRDISSPHLVVFAGHLIFVQPLIESMFCYLSASDNQMHAQQKGLDQWMYPIEHRAAPPQEETFPHFFPDEGRVLSISESHKFLPLLSPSPLLRMR